MGSFFGPELVPLLSLCLPPFLPAGVKDSQLSLSSLLKNIPPSSGSSSSKAGSGAGDSNLGSILSYSSSR